MINVLRDYLDYCPLSGVFWWAKSPKNGISPGDRAGSKSPNGYWTICFKRKNYRAHRLAYAFVNGSWPTGEIDHINGVRDDNRISNLRVVDRGQNCRNAAKRNDNSSGVAGVYWEDKRRFRVQIEKKHVGIYHDFFEACCARKSAERQLGYHLNHGRDLEKGGAGTFLDN